MAKKPVKVKKPRPPKPVVVIEQPVEKPELPKTNSEKLFDLLKSKIALIGTLAAAAVSILTLVNNWDNFHLPRIAFNTEIHSVRKQVYSLEVEFRQRAKRNDQRSLYEIDEKIASLKEKHREIPDELYQQKDRILEDMKDNQEKLDKAIKKLDN